MNIEVVKSAWRRINKPSRKTIESLEPGRTKEVYPPSGRDFWPDYAPRSIASLERSQWERKTRTLTAQTRMGAA